MTRAPSRPWLRHALVLAIAGVLVGLLVLVDTQLRQAPAAAYAPAPAPAPAAADHPSSPPVPADLTSPRAPTLRRPVAAPPSPALDPAADPAFEATLRDLVLHATPWQRLELVEPELALTTRIAVEEELAAHWKPDLAACISRSVAADERVAVDLVLQLHATADQISTSSVTARARVADRDVPAIASCISHGLAPFYVSFEASDDIGFLDYQGPLELSASLISKGDILMILLARGALCFDTTTNQFIDEAAATARLSAEAPGH